jgi:hypothetical protein
MEQRNNNVKKTASQKKAEKDEAYEIGKIMILVLIAGILIQIAKQL